MDKIKLYIVDDHKIVREGLKAVLQNNPYIEITGEAESGKTCIELLQIAIPDIILLDLALPDVKGTQLAKQILSFNNSIKVIILTSNTNSENVIEAIKNGVFGFLDKDVSTEELIEAIRLVFEGENYFGQKISRLVYKSYSSYVKNENDVIKAAKLLSERETEIIKHFSDGFSFKEIGNILHISPRTVENHKNNILEKLNLKNTIELVKYAIKYKIINLD